MRVADFGIVVIGRNEGERLCRCLESVRLYTSFVVYVDSGSKDASVEMAERLGASIVNLDMSTPFTAARARNEGFERLCALAPGLRWVQFVDGDCEVREGWLETALEFLERHVEVVAVCGRRRERAPERSIYNAMCDAEWDTPVGQARSCGGDVLMRAEALRAAGGYNPQLIAGEEPELCVRLRQAGGKIWRLDAEMTWHDAAMTRFGQWWKRGMRAGYAFAQGVQLHGAPPERHCVQAVRRLWVWGLFLPLLAILMGAISPYWLLLLSAYPAQIVRLALRKDGGNREHRAVWQRAGFLVLGKFPEMLGAAKFLRHRLLGQTGRLIEYK